MPLCGPWVGDDEWPRWDPMGVGTVRHAMNVSMRETLGPSPQRALGVVTEAHNALKLTAAVNESH